MISAACLLLACETFAGPNIYGRFASLEENSSRKHLYIYGNGILNLSICQQLHTGHGEMEIKVLS